MCDAHQSEEDAKQLSDVSVGDRIETSEKRVADSDQSRQDDRHFIVDVDDDGQRRTCEKAQKTRKQEADDALKCEQICNACKVTMNVIQRRGVSEQFQRER